MSWADLKLWADGEEQRIQECIEIALQRLISAGIVRNEDGELDVSGNLRPFLIAAKKELKLAWVINPEVSCFAGPTSPKPIGHPDFRFSHDTPNHDQYDYDVECKLVRVKRPGKSHDYCDYYVSNGMTRYRDGIYAQSNPPMGTIIGYVQEGDVSSLLDFVNSYASSHGFHTVAVDGVIKEGGVTYLRQVVVRSIDQTSLSFTLSHLWADVRS